MLDDCEEQSIDIDRDQRIERAKSSDEGRDVSHWPTFPLIRLPAKYQHYPAIEVSMHRHTNWPLRFPSNNRFEHS
jgi:hypothetical protein